MSNYLEGLESKTLFGTRVDPQDELGTLITLFRRRGEISVALQLSMLILGGSRNDNEWRQNMALVDALCVELSDSKELSDMHRMLSVQLFVLKQSRRKDFMNEKVNKRIGQCQESLNIFESHGLRSPTLAFDLAAIRTYYNSSSSPMESFQGFLDLSDRAHENCDYVRERQCLVEARNRINEAVSSCEKENQEIEGHAVPPEVPLSEHKVAIGAAPTNHVEISIHCRELARRRQLADELKLRRLSFETETTRSALCLGFALLEFSSEMVNTGKSAEFLKYFEDFKDRHSGFDVPSTMYTLNLVAERGADQLNNQRIRNFYRKAKERFEKLAFEYVMVDGVTRLTLSAQNEPLHYQREDYSPDYQQLIQNVVRRMLEWATIELREGRLANTGVEKLFQDGEIAQDTKTCFSVKSDSGKVLYALDPIKVALKMYGYGLEPTTRNVWLSYFEPIEAWLRNECQASFEERRHWVLKMLQHSRCSVIRHSSRDSISERGHINDELCELLYQENLDYARILGSINDGAKGTDNNNEVKRAMMDGICNLSTSVTAIQHGRVTDAMLRQHTDDLGQQLCEQYRRTGNFHHLYYNLCQRSLVATRRYIFFQTVEPDAALPYLEEADGVYCHLRQNAAASQFQKTLNAKSFRSKFEMVQRLGHDGVYTKALQSSLWAYLRSFNPPASHQTWITETAQRRLVNLSSWVERSKARSLLDELGVGARVPKRLLATVESKAQYSEALSKEALYITQLEAAEKAGLYADEVRLRDKLMTLRDHLLSEPTLREVMDIRQGVSVTMAEISKMLDGFESGTTLVSYVHIIGQEKSNLWVIHYRRGMQPEVRHTITMEQVNAWVSQNLDGDEPFSNEDSRSKLDEMNPLVESLGHLTEPGDRVVLCPTQALHRIPLHALKVSGQILIKRNPVTYTQSLSILRQCQLKSEDVASDSGIERKTTIISPLPNTWQAPPTTYHGMESSPQTTMLCHDYIPEETALTAMTGATIFTFHGHATFFKNRTRALQQSLNLGLKRRVAEPDTITAEQIFSVSLHPAALALLVGCRSGRAQISQADDLLGLSTALYYAGATSVVSTLWKIDNDDAIAFMRGFFRCLCQEGSTCAGGGGTGVLDLARVMHKAVGALMEMDGAVSSESSPYRWAAFSLNGFWEIPRDFLPVSLSGGVGEG